MNQENNRMGKGRLKFVDGLRGIAALMVVVYHLAPNSLGWIKSQGYLGVDIFFVLSGFVIASVIGETHITGSYLGRFVLRRCLRLDIPYWVNIALGIILGFVVVYFGAPARHFGLEQIAAHLFYLQAILGFKNINDAYWTLCFEIQFYLSLVLLIWLAQRTGRSVKDLRFQLFVFATLAVSLLFSAHALPIPRGLMLGYWWNFALGALAWWVVANGAPWLLLAAAAVLTITLPSAEHITGALVAVALFGAAEMDAMGKWLADPITQFLGRISYSLYLFHPLTGWEAQAFAARYMGKWSAFSVGMIVSIASAWVIYRLIERPAIALSRRVPLVAPPVQSLCASHSTGTA